MADYCGENVVIDFDSIHCTSAPGHDGPHRTIGEGADIYWWAERVAMPDANEAPRRTITLDLDTGEWVTEATLQPGDSARLAASVLPGMPEAEIDKAYSAWMQADPPPPSTDRPRLDADLSATLGRLRGGIEL